MPENQKYSAPRRRPNAQPKQFDVSPGKPNPKPFPTVGMTLNTYKNTGSTTNKPLSVPDTAPRASRTSRVRQSKITKRIIIFLVTILILIVGYLGFKFIYNAHRLFGSSIFSALSSGKLDGESSGRVNILLAGNSADDPGHQGGALTDSIMIMSLDTKNKTAFMLSVPRDLYVQIPGSGHQKINSAYPIGEKNKFSRSGYFDGGMGLLQKTLEDDLGVKCQYYALVNYNALRDAVNSVGGINITVNSTDKRGLYDPSRDYSAKKAILVKLSNGEQHLNGQQALNLARARGDAPGSYGFANSDFDRTAHQRQLILAIRAKATTAGVLTNPLKLGSLFDSIGSNVDTNLKLNNVKRLYELTKGIPGKDIQSLGLNDANGQNLLKNQRTATGALALVPAAGVDDYSDIQRYLQREMSNNLVVRENATVVLLNGTSTSGLAGRESERLSTKNVMVSSVADADNENYTTTQIINVSGANKPATLKALQGAFPGSTVSTSNPFGTKYKVDYIVVLGTDRVVTKSSTSQ